MAATSKQGSATHMALGRRGEDIAAQYLHDHGCVVLARNWRAREGELDIIGTDGSTLVVCEVKTRSGTACGQPAEAISDDKIARIRRLTEKWLCEKQCGWVPIRFDVIAVLLTPDGQPRVQHYPGAF